MNLRRKLLVAFVLALPLAGACIPKRHAADALPHKVGPNPLAGATLYVDPNTAARHIADSWRSSRPEDAAAMAKIASQPAAEWLGEWSGNVRNFVKQRVSIVTGAGA